MIDKKKPAPEAVRNQLDVCGRGAIFLWHRDRRPDKGENQHAQDEQLQDQQNVAL